MTQVEENDAVSKELVQLARLALAARRQDVQLFLRRFITRFDQTRPEVTSQLAQLLRDSPAPQSPFRGIATAEPVPVDQDTKLTLIKTEFPVQLEVEPVWSEAITRVLQQIVKERRQEAVLQAQGLVPTRTALFVGPPGVGKTLAAKWLARELDRPLLVLDLASVMSSFLGRTGNNIRFVLDYAKSIPCVLLLDELDSIAKRRDDATDVGELKRLVTVLLQEIDDWPPSGILVGATNHPDLLDRAVWRRFDCIVEMPLPAIDQIQRIVMSHLANADDGARQWGAVLVHLFAGESTSFSDLSRELHRIRREAATDDESLSERIRSCIRDRAGRLPRRAKSTLAMEMIHVGFSQRQTHELTGVSRDTIRRLTNDAVHKKAVR